MTDTEQDQNNTLTSKEANRLSAQQISDMAHQGGVVPVDPDQADYMGASEENALTPVEALESFDQVDRGTGEPKDEEPN